MDWTLMICAVLGSAGAFSLIEFLINRRDKRNTLLLDIKKEIDEMKEERRRDRATDSRRRILSANDEILHNVVHSKEWWEQILQDVDDYEKYCESHQGYKNSRAILAIESLKTTYSMRLSRNDFLV